MRKRSIFKLAALVLALVFTLASLTACGSSSEKTAETTKSAGTTVDQASTVQNADASPITFTYFNFNTGVKVYPWEESLIAKKITEKTGVTLNVETIVGSNMDEKAGVMLASGEFADFIEPVQTTNKFIAASAVAPLDELIEKNAPNIKKLWGDSLNKLRDPNDGKIYYIGNTPRNRSGDIVDANQSLLIQYDVLEKTGWPKPQTLEEVQKVLQDYLQKVPNLNGKPFIPWGMWADTWGYNITVNNPAQWTNGLSDDGDSYVDPSTYDIKYFNATNNFKDWLKWLNTMYNSKMIDKNAFITKNDQYRSLLSTGRVLAMIDGTWDIGESEAALRKAGMPERCYARLPIVKEKGIQDRSQIDCESYSWGISISKACKDPVRAIKFLDFFATDEGAKLLNWGIEGVHYDVVDGKRVRKPEIAKKWNEDPKYKSKEMLGTWNLGQLGGSGTYLAQKLDDGDLASPRVSKESFYENADAASKKVLDQYGVKAWGQLFDMTGKPNEYGFAWTLTQALAADSKGNLAAKKADEYRHAMVPKIVMSKNDDEFNKNWEKFIKTLYDDCKVADFETDMTKILKDRLKLWKVIK